MRDGYLVNPVAVDARTEITTELLSEKGYSVMIENDDGNKVEHIYYHKDFGNKFLSEETNRIFCKTFIENALRDPISGEIGKTIIFCVSQNHASKITQILNEFADRLYPDKYNSDFALQVTSNVQDSQQFTINFTDTSNNLSGHSRGGGEYNAIGEYENLNSDPLISFSEYAVGMDGMKIDRMFFDKFDSTVRANPFIKENFER